MSRAAKSKKLPSYEDILALPEGITGEIIDGELLTSPRPHPIHQYSMLKLSTPLDAKYGRGGGARGGWLFLTEPQLHLQEYHVVPDIAGWRVERLPGAPAMVFTQPVVTATPQWVCEILSPTSGKRDRVLKRRIYLNLKIDYYWIIDPLNQTVEAYRASDPAQWTEIGVFGGDEKAKIEPFGDMELDLSTLWLGK